MLLCIPHCKPIRSSIKESFSIRPFLNNIKTLPKILFWHCALIYWVIWDLNMQNQPASSSFDVFSLKLSQRLEKIQLGIKCKSRKSFSIKAAVCHCEQSAFALSLRAWTTLVWRNCVRWCFLQRAAACDPTHQPRLDMFAPAWSPLQDLHSRSNASHNGKSILFLFAWVGGLKE